MRGTAECYPPERRGFKPSFLGDLILYMDISIVIPTFNSEKYIDNCLKSIFKSDFNGQFEVVIVDGGSTDLTLEMAARYKNVVVISSSNISVSNSRNCGASISSGEIIIFIDSDCVVNDQLLKKSKLYLEKYACYGSFYNPDPSHGWVSTVWLDIERKKDGLVEWLTSGTLAVKRSLFNDIGGFNESLQAEEDEDFCYRIRASGGKIYNDSSVASVHLGQSNSLGDFFKKETWRGKSLLKPFKLIKYHKISLFDIIVLVYFASTVTAIISIYKYKLFFTLFSIALLIPLLFTLRALFKIDHKNTFFKVFLLYNIYFFARAWSIIKYKQWKNFLR